MIEPPISALASPYCPSAVAAALRLSPETVARFADHPSGYLAMNRDMCHFTAGDHDGFIAYRPFGSFLFQLGGVFAPPENQRRLLQQFQQTARRAGKHICAVQLRPEDLALYQNSGFCINQFGASYTLHLPGFRTSGTAFMKMRNKIARARKAGITVCELSIDAPRTPAVGVIELINITAIERFQREGAVYLNFGLTPFFGLSQATDCVPTRSKALSWLLRMLARHGSALYPAQSQVQCKLKWHPETIVPEYIAFEGRFRFSMAWRLLLLTRAI